MKRLLPFLFVSISLIGCKKSNSLSEQRTYQMFQRIDFFHQYTVGPSGYYETNTQDTTAVDYTESLGFGFNEDVNKKFILLGSDTFFADTDTYTKSGPVSLGGLYGSITIKGDSIFIFCLKDQWQTWSKSYSIRGIIKK